MLVYRPMRAAGNPALKAAGETGESPWRVKGLSAAYKDHVGIFGVAA